MFIVIYAIVQHLLYVVLLVLNIIEMCFIFKRYIEFIYSVQHILSHLEAQV